ncbi:FadR/GntR family transcriptional regulator [Paenibacillus protaetiae]|uniref:FadR family transcriptional regulator n=1 Tax=Paenibacillus protaetiae TaxID=2509456 RepID=A0A4P6ETT0_9BACL|nr:FadR/GntR family transcriptional regulator [Paenibacillus protaetiae]QAY65865.1 FadR family transcriptional regulator [Paenibacillus protaetiae]
MLQKTNRLTLVEQVAHQLEALIESGNWEVGKRIPPEPELMEQLAVSRNTLREAIRALTHAGLLTTRQGDGTYVSASSALGPMLQKRISRTDALETLEVRQALEREAAYLAAQRRSEQDLLDMRRCLEERQAAIHDRNDEGYAYWDVRFHMAVVAAAGNRLLQDLYSHITEGMRAAVLEVYGLNNSDYFEHTHELLYQAIADQHAEKAVEAVQLYINESKKHL